jgi:hypothetical protein
MVILHYNDNRDNILILKDILLLCCSLKYISSGVSNDVATAVRRLVDEILGQYAMMERDDIFIEWVPHCFTTIK